MSTIGSASQGSGTNSGAVAQASNSSPSSVSPTSSSAQAPAATSRLVAPSGFAGSIGGTVSILLSTGQQDITIIDRPGTISLTGASGGNDIVRFAGSAASYTITRSGSRVIISDGDTSVAIAVNWIGSRHWTFRLEHRRPAAREALEFAIVSIGGMVIAVGCLVISHYVLGFTSLLADNIASNVVGLALGSAFRFTLYRGWVFHPRRAPQPTPEESTESAA